METIPSTMQWLISIVIATASIALVIYAMMSDKTMKNSKSWH